MSFSQADQLRLRIEDDILTFRLKPGERLDESKLADKYGTSRTPVREALRQLSSNGLIEIRAHKGAIVAKLSIRDLIELFEVMAELEGACARYAAKNGMAGDLNAIAIVHNASRIHLESKDIDRYAKASNEFHAAVCQASGNSYLVKLTTSMRNRAAPYRRLSLEQANRLLHSFDEHQQILDAILKGNAEEADKLMRSHILDRESEIRRFVSIFSEMDGQVIGNTTKIQLGNTNHFNGASAK